MMILAEQLRPGVTFRWLGRIVTCAEVTPLYDKRTPVTRRFVELHLTDGERLVLWASGSISVVEPAQHQESASPLVAFAPLLSESVRTRIRGLEQAPQEPVKLDELLLAAGLVEHVPHRENGVVVSELVSLTALGWEFHRWITEA